MKKIVLLILIGAEWYLAAMYHSHLLLALSMTTAVLLVVLFVMPRIQKRGYKAAFTLSGRTMTKGAQEQLEMENQKRGLLPLPRLRYDILAQYEGEKKPARLKFVGGCQSKRDTLQLPLQPKYSGMLTLHLKKARLYDPLGVFSSSKKQDSQIRLAVLPQMSTYTHMIPEIVDLKENRAGIQPDAKPGMDGDLRQIRGWIPGDKPSRIHWNLTARMQETMVREWNEESASVETLQLKKETKVYTAEEADAFYEKLSADVQSMLEEGTTVRVQWTDQHKVPQEMTVHATEDLEDLLLKLMDSSWLWEGSK